MRLQKLTREQTSTEQRIIWDEIVAGPRAKMHGPFFILLHSPDLLSRAEKLGLYARYQSSLPPRISELCILIMASHWKCAGEWIDHEGIAISQGIDPMALDALRRAQPARFTQEDEIATYELSQELFATREVSDATYARAKAALGERGLLDVIAVFGYYSLIAISMKTFDMKPDGATDPFADR